MMSEDTTVSEGSLESYFSSSSSGDSYGSYSFSGSRSYSEHEAPYKLSKVIIWPSNDHFTIKQGFIKIDELISTWDRKGYWKHCIDFLTRVNAISCDYYLYEVKWSIPSKMFPIPAVTASIFFRIAVNHLKSEDEPVEVTYQFEGCRVRHIVGRIQFQEKWLEDILLYKLIIYPNVTF
ncbi:hypothetical protein C0J52_23905 [Blattella germanica]|nr:hypothetical protein C0J52_23905 [Blattella germanica]